MILYRAGAVTSVTDTYSIDEFNTKAKIAVLKQRQDWKVPQIKNSNLVIAEHYTFMASNSLFIVLGKRDRPLEKTTRIKATLLPGAYKTSLDTSFPPKLLSLHCRQISRILKSRWATIKPVSVHASF